MELTPEMMTEIETIAKSKLQNKMEADNSMMETAEKFAKLSVKELYEPIIRSKEDAAYEEADDENAIPVHYSVDVVID